LADIIRSNGIQTGPPNGSRSLTEIPSPPLLHRPHERIGTGRKRMRNCVP
jgi:hypothetical protein